MVTPIDQFFVDAEAASAAIWSQRAARNLRSPPRRSGYYSPVNTYHGIRGTVGPPYAPRLAAT